VAKVVGDEVKVRIVVDGLPGLECSDSRSGETWSNVHVGVQRGQDVDEIKPATGKKLGWTLPVTFTADDVRGPHVQGKKGDRFVYLAWGVADDAATFGMFRRAKIFFATAPPHLVDVARNKGGVLEAQLPGTDARGGPNCGGIRPPGIEWVLVAR
jgi:hypothetical protein